MKKLPIHPENQQKMTDYMRNQFDFNGVTAVERHKFERDIWNEIKNYSAEDLLKIIEDYYAMSAREYQYLAIDLAVRAKRKWNKQHLLHFLKLVQTKMWWDSIDAWRKVFSEYLKLHPEEIDWIVSLFEDNEIFWLRRISIILQLGFKEQTNTEVLTRLIVKDKDTDEFFIQKAIGWALRDYSKTDSKWVNNFLNKNKITGLAKKEAAKYL